MTDVCSGGACTGSGTIPGLNDNNSCTNDTCVNGAAVHTNNTAACDDNDACTQTDTCQNGSCSGANPKTCTASDQCHNVGICDPANGNCPAGTPIDSGIQNECGGCQTLTGTKGATCDGPDADSCIGGTLQCSGINALTCQNDNSVANNCGGCEALSNQPNTSCDQNGDGCTGTWTCNGADAVTCTDVQVGDGDTCTTDSCTNGQVVHATIQCPGQTACDQAVTCANGSCPAPVLRTDIECGPNDPGCEPATCTFIAPTCNLTCPGAIAVGDDGSQTTFTVAVTNADPDGAPACTLESGDVLAPVSDTANSPTDHSWNYPAASSYDVNADGTISLDCTAPGRGTNPPAHCACEITVAQCGLNCTQADGTKKVLVDSNAASNGGTCNKVTCNATLDSNAVGTQASYSTPLPNAQNPDVNGSTVQGDICQTGEHHIAVETTIDGVTVTCEDSYEVVAPAPSCYTVIASQGPYYAGNTLSITCSILNAISLTATLDGSPLDMNGVDLADCRGLQVILGAGPNRLEITAHGGYGTTPTICPIPPITLKTLDCGDGTTDPGELCDDGNEDNTDACVNCKVATCRDGAIRTGAEECDDGNTENTDTCLNDCTLPSCGDEHLQVGIGEECEPILEALGCHQTSCIHIPVCSGFIASLVTADVGQIAQVTVQGIADKFCVGPTCSGPFTNSASIDIPCTAASITPYPLILYRGNASPTSRCPAEANQDTTITIECRAVCGDGRVEGDEECDPPAEGACDSNCQTITSIPCPDGSTPDANGNCPTPTTTLTCDDGTVVTSLSDCPTPPTEYTCDDETVVTSLSECVSCPYGGSVGPGLTCPPTGGPNPTTCPDGTVVTYPDDCPEEDGEEGGKDPGTTPGSCGDKIVQPELGEECDPPGELDADGFCDDRCKIDPCASKFEKGSPDYQCCEMAYHFKKSDQDTRYSREMYTQKNASHFSLPLYTKVYYQGGGSLNYSMSYDEPIEDAFDVENSEAFKCCKAGFLDPKDFTETYDQYEAYNKRNDQLQQMTDKYSALVEKYKKEEGLSPDEKLTLDDLEKKMRKEKNDLSALQEKGAASANRMKAQLIKCECYFAPPLSAPSYCYSCEPDYKVRSLNRFVDVNKEALYKQGIWIKSSPALKREKKKALSHFDMYQYKRLRDRKARLQKKDWVYTPFDVPVCECRTDEKKAISDPQQIMSLLGSKTYALHSLNQKNLMSQKNLTMMEKEKEKDFCVPPQILDDMQNPKRFQNPLVVVGHDEGKNCVMVTRQGEMMKSLLQIDPPTCLPVCDCLETGTPLDPEPLIGGDPDPDPATDGSGSTSKPTFDTLIDTAHLPNPSTSPHLKMCFIAEGSDIARCRGGGEIKYDKKVPLLDLKMTHPALFRVSKILNNGDEEKEKEIMNEVITAVVTADPAKYDFKIIHAKAKKGGLIPSATEGVGPGKAAEGTPTTAVSQGEFDQKVFAEYIIPNNGGAPEIDNNGNIYYESPNNGPDSASGNNGNNGQGPGSNSANNDNGPPPWAGPPANDGGGGGGSPPGAADPLAVDDDDEEMDGDVDDDDDMDDMDDVEVVDGFGALLLASSTANTLTTDETIEDIATIVYVDVGYQGSGGCSLNQTDSSTPWTFFGLGLLILLTLGLVRRGKKVPVVLKTKKN